MHYPGLIHKYPLISDQIDHDELRVILDTLERQLIQGRCQSVVEFGCYAGTTSLFLRRLLDVYDSNGPFHVYDSFAGLPDKTAFDLSPAGEQFKTGELRVARQEFVRNFKKANLRLPVIHKGWFDDLEPADIPDSISFAFLDGDYYDSVFSPLQLIWPKLVPGAVIIIDDYMNEALPGAARATHDWLRAHPAQLRTHASLAIITVPHQNAL